MLSERSLQARPSAKDNLLTSMNSVQATEFAESLEYRLGTLESGLVEAYAIPRSKGSSRRTTRWLFLIVTDLPEDHVRDTLREVPLELFERRGARYVYLAWPD